ncbi:hypothetical protein BRADI_1g48173v3 [Brachypodium distachyon]|uniref:Alpha/beta hydrolase fold-3 domain-containing protein n=1 Tax=Brachypodium distachyon TaxID=15368 RepID=A0A0Q3L8F3_BRADI|nr:hypothetical protein BRADI_1g48173v3 [Brachypodium distachyon]
MHAKKSTSPAEETKDEVMVNLHPFLREHTGGRIERVLRSTFVPSSEDPSSNRGIATKFGRGVWGGDLVIAGTADEALWGRGPHDPRRGHASGNPQSPQVDPGSTRAQRTQEPPPGKQLPGSFPVVVYIHGGCASARRAPSAAHTATTAAWPPTSAGALVVSVEYRLAPEHPVPAAHDDAWAVLRWAASFSDPWLAHHADPELVFVASDSAGGNIAYHTAVRASQHGSMDVQGLVVLTDCREVDWGGAGAVFLTWLDRVWPYVTAGRAGNDDPRIDPTAEEISSLMCKRVLVAVAGKDMLRERGQRLADRICYCWRRPSMMIGGSNDDVILVESEGEDHGFHLYSPLRATSKKLMESIVHFINFQRTTTAADSLTELPAAFLAEPHELHNLHASKTSAGEMGSARPFVGVPTRSVYGRVWLWDGHETCDWAKLYDASWCFTESWTGECIQDKAL